MQKPTILLADKTIERYKIFLEILGQKYNILYSPNGEFAKELAITKKADIIYVGQFLTDIYGLDFVKSIKIILPSTPVIFIVEKPSPDLVLTAFRIGARDLLTLPINNDELEKTSQKLISLVHHPKTNLLSHKSSDVQQNPSSVISKFTTNIYYPLNITYKFLDSCRNLFQNYLRSFRKDPLIITSDPLITNSTSVESIKTQNRIKNSEVSKSFLQIHSLGTFQVMIDGKILSEWHGKKCKEIFAYLSINHKRKIYREVLMELFWPNSSPSSARNCLNVTMHNIRHFLQPMDFKNDLILFKDDCYSFNQEISFQIDVEQFRLTWREAEYTEREKKGEEALKKYEQAACLYEGDFMEDYIYADWPSVERENLKEIYLFILERISNYYSLNGKPETAIGICEKILEKDNCREDIHRRLMMCYKRVGMRDKAIKQFQKCVDILHSEFKVEPAGETFNLYNKIKNDSIDFN